MNNSTFLNISTLYSYNIPYVALDLTGLSYVIFNAVALFLSTCFYIRLIKLITKLLERNSSKAVLPPGPVPWPFFGNLPELFRNKPRFRWITGILNDVNTDIACVRVRNTHIIPVKCPDIACEFLVKQDTKFAFRPTTMATEHMSHDFLSVVLEPGGDHWKKMRRVVASEVLSQPKLRWLRGKRDEEADNLIHYIYNQCGSTMLNSDGGGAIVNLRHATRAYCGNVMRKIIFNRRYFGEGRKDGAPTIEEEEHVEALFTGLSLVYAFCVSDYMPSLRWLDLDGHEKIMKTVTQIVNKYHDPIIYDRIQKWRGGDVKVSSKEPEDLLDVLILLKDNKGKPLLSTEEIRAQTAELFHAAVDNPSNAVEWVIAEMINQPEILRKAVEEIDIVVGKDRLVQESDFPKLNYVKACAREGFRLHPIAPFNLPHVSNVDTTVAGYFIPKGSHVLLSRTELGRNPRVWDEPLEYKPERHLKLNSDGSFLDVELHEPELRFISLVLDVVGAWL
ncbi:hypothetical protein IFM89_023332 [Coptis chinensis]|uniref:Cytochrome P450 n=1 Tax=Coptis chinensis TaxID=261450 RepID=A0A835HLH5_9MAGN|nr:hypothetical protein IFM89_023332 [Coptis chinensis]